MRVKCRQLSASAREPRPPLYSGLFTDVRELAPSISFKDDREQLIWIEVEHNSFAVSGDRERSAGAGRRILSAGPKVVDRNGGHRLGQADHGQDSASNRFRSES